MSKNTNTTSLLCWLLLCEQEESQPRDESWIFFLLEVQTGSTERNVFCKYDKTYSSSGPNTYLQHQCAQNK